MSAGAGVTRNAAFPAAPTLHISVGSLFSSLSRSLTSSTLVHFIHNNGKISFIRATKWHHGRLLASVTVDFETE